jgi:CTP:molybdopterin cytidylyltransferase MocA
MVETSEEKEGLAGALEWLEEEKVLELFCNPTLVSRTAESGTCESLIAVAGVDGIAETLLLRKPSL